VVLILSTLEILISNWSYESVFKYVKSGLIKLDREFIDKLENHILLNGIKGYKWTGELLKGIEEPSKEEIEIASDTRSRIFEEQFMVYTALTIASEYLMITYPMADFEGKSLRPSIIIRSPQVVYAPVPLHVV